MLDAAVVPEGDGVGAPAEAALEQRVLHVLVEIAQDAVALVARHADQAAGEAAIDVERLLAGHGVCANHRVLGARVLRLVRHTEILVEAAIDRLAVVDRGHALEIPLHAVAERFVGGVHAGEQRVAAFGRAGLDVEDAAHRRLDIAGDVGVPTLAIGARAVLVGVDDHQLGLARLVRRGGMQVQVAPQPAEGEVLVGRDGLVAEENHRVLGQRAVQLVDGLVAERPAEVDATHLRAEDRREFVDGDALVGKLIARDVLVAGAGIASHLRARHSHLRHSAFRPAARITLPQLSISLAVKAANSSTFVGGGAQYDGLTGFSRVVT